MQQGESKTVYMNSAPKRIKKTNLNVIVRVLLKYGKYCVIVEEGTFKKDVHKATQNVPKIEKKESHN